MFPGFPNRLQNEVQSIFNEKILKDNKDNMAKSKIKIKVIVSSILLQTGSSQAKI